MWLFSLIINGNGTSTYGLEKIAAKSIPGPMVQFYVEPVKVRVFSLIINGNGTFSYGLEKIAAKNVSELVVHFYAKPVNGRFFSVDYQLEW